MKNSKTWRKFFNFTNFVVQDRHKNSKYYYCYTLFLVHIWGGGLVRLNLILVFFIARTQRANGCATMMINHVTGKITNEMSHSEVRIPAIRQKWNCNARILGRDGRYFSE